MCAVSSGPFLSKRPYIRHPMADECTHHAYRVVDFFRPPSLVLIHRIENVAWTAPERRECTNRRQDWVVLGWAIEYEAIFSFSVANARVLSFHQPPTDSMKPAAVGLNCIFLFLQRYPRRVPHRYPHCTGVLGRGDPDGTSTA